MTTRTIANMIIHVNDEGFLTDAREWTRDVAGAIALEDGIALLNADHWRVIDFCRANATAAGKSPTLRQITTGTGLSTKTLFTLFPKGPAKKVARIAGLGKPEGCV
jgi:dissimilatory sulfite reductase related protein